MTSINNYQCHYTLIKKMMTSKIEDRLRKNGVKIKKVLQVAQMVYEKKIICMKWERCSTKSIFSISRLASFIAFT